MVCIKGTRHRAKNKTHCFSKNDEKYFLIYALVRQSRARDERGRRRLQPVAVHAVPPVHTHHTPHTTARRRARDSTKAVPQSLIVATPAQSNVAKVTQPRLSDSRPRDVVLQMRRGLSLLRMASMGK
jgi:hypothetical protein